MLVCCSLPLWRMLYLLIAADNDGGGDLPSTVTTASSNNKKQLQMRESFKKALAPHGAPHGFPEDSTFHASCHMSVLLPSTTCVDAKAQTENLIKTNIDTGGEGSEYKGTMSIHDQGKNVPSDPVTTRNHKTVSGEPSVAFAVAAVEFLSIRIFQYFAYAFSDGHQLQELPLFSEGYHD